MTTELLIEQLNHTDMQQRLAALSQLMEKINKGELPRPVTGTDVNNHIHTTYSFSPYSPTKAVWMAYNAGLATAGIMDHDSVAGIDEFHQAGKIVGIATTGGFECRVSFKNTSLAGRKINNPDQATVAYMTLHGLAVSQLAVADAFLADCRDKRNIRNRKMIERINGLLSGCGIVLDFDKDVLPLSNFAEGGGVTERHLLFALVSKLLERFSKGSALVDFLKNQLGMNLSAKVEGMLLDVNNPYYSYDLLGLLKGELVEKFYIDADDECPDVADFLKLGHKVGGITAYAYLGDVGDSVTGDKKAQKFEDDYLDELFELLADLGLDAVTYMPSRNTPAQLSRVKALCDRYGFFQVSGEDINSPRQSFVCLAARAPEFANLIDSTWALIGHEKAISASIEDAMFSERVKKLYPDLMERTAYFKTLVGR